MTDYRYITADLVTDVDKADIPLVDASYGPALNGGGVCQGFVPLVSGVKEADLTPGKTALYCYRDDQLLWGGIVWSLVPRGSRVEVFAASFESYLAHRIMLRRFGPYTGADPVTLARELWNYAQVETLSSIGVEVGSETTSGKVKVGTTAEPYVVEWWDHRRLGDLLDDLAEADDGFDYRIDLSVNTNGTRRKRLVFGYPRLGARKNLSVVSGMQVRSTPTEVVDGSFLANYLVVIGAGEGSKQLLSRHSVDRQGWPRLDAAVPWKSEANLARLQARGRAELAARTNMSSVPQVTMAADHPDLPLGSYVPGDELWFDLNDGWTDYQGWGRIMGWKLNPATEEITMDIARADLFAYGPSPDLGSSS